jgi:hypothetical protein
MIATSGRPTPKFAGAKILAAPFKQHAEFELEPRRVSGKHADFKVRLIGEEIVESELFGVEPG